MRKVKLFLLILLFILAFTVSCAKAEIKAEIILGLPETEIITEAKLPAALKIIEDEAFEGTAFVKVELPITVESLGERAFANITTLREIRIPLTTRYIASTSFDGSDRTTIIAPANSYARAYARNHELPFSPIVMFCATMQGSSNQVITSNRSSEVVETATKTNFSPETQWRRIEELDISRTEELISNHVQGRAPPMA